jgi:hypothetical protein
MSLTKATFSMITGAVANVLDFIPQAEHAAIIAGTSTYDCTSAFNSAIATQKRVFIPNGTYPVADVNLLTNANIEGESRTFTILEVRTNNSGVFTYASVFQANVKNLTARAATGVTNARFIKQTDASQYSAYVTFTNIETSANLLYSYDGFFIFTTWQYCRDGYVGAAGATHVFIKSRPASSSQNNSTNICQVLQCQAFGATGVLGSVNLAFGAQWIFRDTDFEGNQTSAIIAEGIRGLHADGCWFELNAASNVILCDNSAAPNTQGTVVNFNNNYYAGDVSNLYFIRFNGASYGSVTNLNCAVVPAACKLTNLTLLTELYNIQAFSGTGAATFTTGIYALRSELKISSSEMTSGIINSPQTQNQNMLPIGPSGLGASNFTNVSFTSITDVASGIGLSTNAVQFTLSGSITQAAYYTMPTKLLNFLKGKTVTLVAMGYASTYVGTGEILKIAVWDSVGSPTAANSTVSADCVLISTSAELQVGYITLTVGAAATSLKLGFFAGGDAATETVSIETMKLVMGEIKPQTSGLN